MPVVATSEYEQTPFLLRGEHEQTRNLEAEKMEDTFNNRTKRRELFIKHPTHAFLFPSHNNPFLSDSVYIYPLRPANTHNAPWHTTLLQTHDRSPDTNNCFEQIDVSLQSPKRRENRKWDRKKTVFLPLCVRRHQPRIRLAYHCRKSIR